MLPLLLIQEEQLSNTVNSEMFARTLFSLIFTKSGPREFKVLANIENTCIRWLFELIEYLLANSRTRELFGNQKIAK